MIIREAPMRVFIRSTRAFFSSAFQYGISNSILTPNNFPKNIKSSQKKAHKNRNFPKLTNIKLTKLRQNSPSVLRPVHTRPMTCVAARVLGTPTSQAPLGSKGNSLGREIGILSNLISC